MTKKKILNKFSNLVKILSIVAFVFMIAGMFMQQTPFGYADVDAGLLKDTNMLKYDCIFPGKDGENCDGGGEPLIKGVSDWLVGLGAPLAVIVIIWGGYQFMTGGTDSKVQGKKTITNGVIGLVIVISAKVIADVVKKTVTTEGQDGGLNTAPAVEILGQIFNVMTYLSAVVAVIFMVYGGILMITAAGSQEKEKKAKDALKNAVIGLVVVGFSIIIVQIVKGVTKQAITSSIIFDALPFL